MRKAKRSGNAARHSHNNSHKGTPAKPGHCGECHGGQDFPTQKALRTHTHVPAPAPEPTPEIPA